MCCGSSTGVESVNLFSCCSTAFSFARKIVFVDRIVSVDGLFSVNRLSTSLLFRLLLTSSIFYSACVKKRSHAALRRYWYLWMTLLDADTIEVGSCILDGDPVLGSECRQYSWKGIIHARQQTTFTSLNCSSLELPVRSLPYPQFRTEECLRHEFFLQYVFPLHFFSKLSYSLKSTWY